MIKRFTVHGHSMEPNFYDGDKLLASSLFLNLKKNDVVIFSSGKHEYLKRIKKISENNYIVTGDNDGHTQSWKITRNQIKGKFLIKY